ALPLTWWASIDHRYDPDFTFLALGQAAYLSSFFFLGLGICRYRAELLRPRWVGLAAALLAVYTFIYLAIYINGGFMQRPPLHPKLDWLLLGLSTVSLVMGTTASLVAFGLGGASRPLAWVGSHAYAIYLLHPFAYLWAYTLL